MNTVREEYVYGGLLEPDALADPIEQFRRWFQDAESAGVREPNAIALATCDAHGIPNVRVVLLKGIDTGFLFYTSYESRKARELKENRHAALCIYWRDMGRQVRASGVVERVSRQESEEYFRTRPRGSQIAAWASRQSSEIASRDELERDYAEHALRLGDREVPLPDTWGGYRLTPSTIEFWQGRPNRLHDRLLYERAGFNWTRRRLSP